MEYNTKELLKRVTDRRNAFYKEEGLTQEEINEINEIREDIKREMIEEGLTKV